MSYGWDLVPPGQVSPRMAWTRQYLPVAGALATWAAAVSRTWRAVVSWAGAACAGAVGAPGAASTTAAAVAPATATARPAMISRFRARRGDRLRPGTGPAAGRGVRAARIWASVRCACGESPAGRSLALTGLASRIRSSMSMTDRSSFLRQGDQAFLAGSG